jgi:hypothetical protein
MRAFMRPDRFVICAALAALAAAGCGKAIGDACVIDSDCDPNGGRTCDTTMREGYCTILGCDFDTCPSEAACVRFFSGGFDNRVCDPSDATHGADGCDLDELCQLDGHCAARSSEIRYCMFICQSDGDCRDGYECRTLELMIAHGGEPVLQPGDFVDDTSPKFCAPTP